MKFKYLSIKQKSYEFYVTVIPASFLQKICSTNISDLENSNDIYQRSLNKYRVEQIKHFVARERGILPPAVILNSKQDIIFNGEYIEINDTSDQFFIIDGQHRIFGVNAIDELNYDLCVIIFNNIDKNFQSELFLSINNEQKRVSPLVRFRIKASDQTQTPEKVVKNIALYLNNDISSPFYKLIRITDEKQSIYDYMLTINTFSDLLVSYIYDPRDYFEIKDLLLEKKCVNSIDGNLDKYNAKYGDKILWNFYSSDNWQVILKILLNYFEAIKKYFPVSWGNRKFITTKTTGFNAFMLLFKDVFYCCRKNNNNFSYEYMCDLIGPLSQLDKQMTFENYGTGKAGTYRLYVDFINLSPKLLEKYFDFSIFDDLENITED